MSGKDQSATKQLQKLLKKAKTDLKNEDYDECIKTAKSVLKLDNNNFYAFLFLGKAFEATGKKDDALKAFVKATECNPEHEFGWKGQLALRLESTEFVPFFETVLSYAKIVTQKKEPLTDVIEYVKDYLKQHQFNTIEFKVFYLKQIIPGLSELGDIIGYQMNDPAVSLKQLIKIFEDEETKKIKREDEKTKMTFPVNITEKAKLDKLNEKRWNIICHSEIPQLYEILIDIEQNDDNRYKEQEAYLKYKFYMLQTAPPQSKNSLKDDIKDIIDGMVLIKCPSRFAWNLYFEWYDPHHLGEVPLEQICQYIKMFGKETNYGAVLYNYLISDICLFERSKIVDYLAPKKKRHVKSKKTPADQNTDETTSNDDAIISETESNDNESEIFNKQPQQVLTDLIKGLDSTSNSAFCLRIALDYCVYLKDYALGLELSANLSKSLLDLRNKCGIDLPNTKLSHTLNLATIYTFYEAPKNFFKALELYQSIEKKAPEDTRIKIGKALILVETKRYSEAATIFEELLEKDSKNVSALQEYGWCQVQMGNFKSGRKYLYEAMSLLQDESNSQIKGASLVEQLALVIYRLALSYYLDVEKNREKIEKTKLKEYISSCSKFLLQCLKISPNYAPAFTTLGLVYYNYLGKKDRAIQIFNKAFQLDPAEIEASYKLAEHFTSINDWEMAEIICKGVIENDRARRQLSSSFNKLEDNSWPYRIMGCASMELKNDVKAIEYFQTSLRLNPSELASWIGLGEAYLSRGRIEASIKVFSHVIRLQSGIDDPNSPITTEMENKSDWHTVYLLATALTSMLEFDQSIATLTNLLNFNPEAKNNLCVSLTLIETLILRCENEVRKGAILRASDTLKQIYQYIFTAFDLSSKSIKLWKLLCDALLISLKIQSTLPELPHEKIASLTSHLVSVKNELWDDIDLKSFSVSELVEKKDYLTLGHLFLVLSSIGGYLCSRPSDIKVIRSGLIFNIAMSFILWFRYSNSDIFRDLSIKLLNKAISLEPDNPDYWNSLGVITVSKNGRIAQHCFIKALSIESKSSLYWFNLGMLYVKYADFELANECFTKTQAISPSSSIPWTGMAILDKEIGKDAESKNLFTHSYVLSKGTSPANTLLYTVSVLDTIMSDGSQERDLIAVQQLSTISHGMFNYLKLYPNDVYGLELAISIMERLFSFNKGVEFAEKLCNLLESKYEETESEEILISFCKAKCQLSRFYLAKKEFMNANECCDEVANLLQSVDTLTLEIQKCLLSCSTVLGLSLFFQNKFDEALKEFMKLLDAFPENQRIVTLVSQVLYTSGSEGGKQAAMDELLSAIETQGTSLLISMTIAAIAITEDWDEYIVAVKEVLGQLDLTLLISDTHKEVPTILNLLSSKLKSSSSSARVEKTWQRTAFLFPGDHTAWKNIDEEVSLELSKVSHKESAIAVSESYINVERLREVQRGILLSGGVSEKGLALLSGISI
ncbi:hypothetical protein CANINC_001587 [Pichia inconspicua]|uniref:Superkiller protein 3 n=1 Tax=Pichia inconspicua TaxID=52247 RepID=A0A4T0X3C9_9ASCO|nr:hypothetical protein CANINC_001587 [[Candida] inconspicua]